MGRLGSEGMELGSKDFKSGGWGGQKSWGVGVEAVGVGGVWVEGSGWGQELGLGGGVRRG